MDTLNISTGVVRLSIVRDGESVGELVFNPDDAVVAEKFYKAVEQLHIKAEEMEIRAKELKKAKIQKNGLPPNPQEIVDFARDSHFYMCKQYDYIFGEGISSKVFGEFVPVNERGFKVHDQFVDGFTPYFVKARSEKIAQYTTPATAKRRKRGKK